VPKSPNTLEIERVQTGVRLERRLVKVLKALAEYKNMTLGDLLEGIVLHSFEGKPAFTAETMRKIVELKGIYGLELNANASHRLREKS
jgi:predicted DNA-binding ribbon-helix-helix protein